MFITSTNLFANINIFVKSNICKGEYTSTKFGLDIKSFYGIVKSKTRTNNVIDINFLKFKQLLLTKYIKEFLEFIDSEDENKEKEK